MKTAHKDLSKSLLYMRPHTHKHCIHYNKYFSQKYNYNNQKKNVHHIFENRNYFLAQTIILLNWYFEDLRAKISFKCVYIYFLLFIYTTFSFDHLFSLIIYSAYINNMSMIYIYIRIMLKKNIWLTNCRQYHRIGAKEIRILSLYEEHMKHLLYMCYI